MELMTTPEMTKARKLNGTTRATGAPLPSPAEPKGKPTKDDARTLALHADTGLALVAKIRKAEAAIRAAMRYATEPPTTAAWSALVSELYTVIAAVRALPAGTRMIRTSATPTDVLDVLSGREASASIRRRVTDGITATLA